MTDRAVVVTLRCVRKTQHRDYVLVPVVWKLDRKLELRCGIAKRVTHIIARRSLRMTNRADRRPCATEELRPVTTYACIMTRVIRDVGKSDLVARVAGGLMFLRGVGELRVINR